MFSTFFGGKYTLAKQQGIFERNLILILLYYDLWDSILFFGDHKEILTV
jgi:hypothetical protein